MKKYLKYIYLIFPVLASILMLMPHAVEMNFSTGNGEDLICYYSYYSTMPFGYGDIGPLLTAVATIIILIGLALNIFYFKRYILNGVFVLYILAIAFSVFHLFFNANAYSISITVILILGALLLAPTCIVKAANE